MASSSQDDKGKGKVKVLTPAQEIDEALKSESLGDGYSGHFTWFGEWYPYIDGEKEGKIYSGMHCSTCHFIVGTEQFQDSATTMFIQMPDPDSLKKKEKDHWEYSYWNPEFMPTSMGLGSGRLDCDLWACKKCELS
jgi:hypothetical protein